HRAVEGLGDLIDGYEFHYPLELSHENISDVQEALGDHDIYCVATGLHLDPRFGRGGLVNPDEHVRAEAKRIVCEAAEVCKRHGVKLFLEHKNSEPAMKILMRNMGMTIYVANKLRAEGLDNV